MEEVAERVNKSSIKLDTNIRNDGVSSSFDGAISSFDGVNAQNEGVKIGNDGVKIKKVARTAQTIIDIVISDPSVTQEQMVGLIGVSKSTIERQIRNLREQGILVHEGADKKGYWRVVSGEAKQ